MNYSEIKHFDIANGPGIRTSLFVSGCRLRCRGCFNAVAWSFSSGREFTTEVGDGVIHSVLNPFMDGITILGGEPTEPENQEGLVDFLERARVAFGPRGEKDSKTIWLFSGHTWDELIGGGTQHGPYTDRILACVDVLVDGPFVQEEYDISLRFRGSANQRIIDVPRTLEKGEVVLWHDEALFETPSSTRPPSLDTRRGCNGHASRQFASDRTAKEPWRPSSPRASSAADRASIAATPIMPNS